MPPVCSTATKNYSATFSVDLLHPGGLFLSLIKFGHGSNSRTPSEHPNPNQIGSKMGGEFNYQPKWDPKTVLTTTAILSCVEFLGENVELFWPQPSDPSLYEARRVAAHELVSLAVFHVDAWPNDSACVTLAL